jgi:hypothetical protein
MLFTVTLRKRFYNLSGHSLQRIKLRKALPSFFYYSPDLKVNNFTYISPLARLPCDGGMEGKLESRLHDGAYENRTSLMEEMFPDFLHKRTTAYFCSHTRSSSVMRKDSVWRNSAAAPVQSLQKRHFSHIARAHSSAKRLLHRQAVHDTKLISHLAG